MNEAVNPYAAPGAAVSDVYDQNAVAEPARLFSSQGRVGRLRFLAYSLYAYLALSLFSVVVVVLLPLLGRGSGTFTLAVPILGLLALIPYFWFYVVISIKRSHDMDWSGWSVFAMLIPLVALIWLFAPGTQGPNRFGLPPPPNPLSVKLGAWLILAFMVIGIVAATALPAYQAYTMKAKAAQVEKP